MTYINPFVVLNVTSFDANEVKKSKKKILAAFDLSDSGEIDVDGRKVSKTDFIRSVSELDNEEKSEFYWQLKQNKALDDFLSQGDPSFFANGSFSNKLFTNTNFIKFVSPFFVYQYNILLDEAFKKKSHTLLLKIKNAPKLFLEEHMDKAHRLLRERLRTLNNELVKIEKKISDSDNSLSEEDIINLADKAKSFVNTKLLNELPGYFQSQRNDLAVKLRNISVEVFNNYDDPATALRLIELATSLELAGMTKANIEKDAKQIKDILKDREVESAHMQGLLAYAAILKMLQKLIEDVDEGKTSPLDAYNTVFSKLNVLELNSLPAVFAEIKDQIAIHLRGLSVVIWNKFQNIEVSRKVLNIAASINTSSEVRADISEAITSLLEIDKNSKQKLLDDIEAAFEQIVKTISGMRLSTEGYTIDWPKLFILLNNLIDNDAILTLSDSKYTGTRQRIFSKYKYIHLQSSSFALAYGKSLIDKWKIIAKNDPVILSELNELPQLGNSRSTSTPTAPKEQKPISPTKPLTATGSTIPEQTSQSKPKPASDDESGIGWILGLIGIVVLVWFVVSTNDNAASNRSYNNPKSNYSSGSNTAQQDYNSNTTTPYTPTKVPEYVPPPVSKYKGNKLKNGSSPLGACFGKGSFGGNAWLLFENGNSTDAIVCLVEVTTGKTIRHEYIRAGTNFKMSQIPQGTYYLKVLYGSDWNPTLAKFCGTQGNFETDVNYSKSDSRSDWIEVEDSYGGYTTGEITLYKVQNGNMGSRPVGASEF